MPNLKFKQLSNLPSIAEEGVIYYTSKGEQFIGKSDGTFLGINNSVEFVEELPPNPTFNKIYILLKNEGVETLIYQGFEWVKIGESGNSLTFNDIITILGYTPANVTDVSTLMNYIGNLSDLDTIDKSNLAQAINEVNSKVNELSIKPRKDSLLFITNDVTDNSHTASFDIPYNSTITSIKAILDSTSGTELTYEVQKSTFGSTWNTIGNGSVPVGEYVNKVNTNITVNEEELLRVLITSTNEDVYSITVNVSIIERGV